MKTIKILLTKKEVTVIIFAFVSILVMNSCQSFSPSLQQPAKPLNKGDFNFQASGEFMPRLVKPVGFSGAREYSFGENVVARYGISNRVNLQTKIWVPNDNDLKSFDWGFSIMPTFYLSDVNDDFQYFITPSFTCLQNNMHFNYGAFGSFYGVLFPKVWFLKPYLAGSFQGVWEWEGYNVGLCETINIGFRIPIYKIFDLNFEYTFSFYNYPGNSQYSGSYSSYATPLIGLGINL